MTAHPGTVPVGLVQLQVRDPRWVAFVESCPHALPFHHPAWVDLLAECYGYRAFALALMDPAGAISAGLPVLCIGGARGKQRWASLPFTDYCPLLTRPGSEPALADALATELAARHVTVFEQHAELPEGRHLHRWVEGYRHTLALSGTPASVYSRFSKMHQRNIRKAENSGVRIEHGCSAADVDTFYRLHLMTRRRLGVPVQPRRFFRLLAHRLQDEGLGFVLAAYVQDAPVAAAVFLNWNGTLVYKYGASDQAFWNHRPNNLLFWRAIQWGCENGYTTFDWGRTDAEDQGLRDFKSGWGSREEDLVYSAIADRLPRHSSGWIRRAMGTVIRRSPTWVCQAVGESLYRFAA